MLRRTALQLLALAPAWQLGWTTNNIATFEPWPNKLLIALDWTSIEVRRGKETIIIDPQELFDALKAGKE